MHLELENKLPRAGSAGGSKDDASDLLWWHKTVIGK